MKKVFATVLGLGMMLSVMAVPAFAADFADTDGYYAEGHIDRWTGYGIVEGYGDGNFYPENDMTRAEAAKVFALLLNLTDTTGAVEFSDVPADAWYANYIDLCSAAGIMNGYGDGTVGPDDTLTREMMITMLGRALGVEPETSLDSDKYFSDYDGVDDWAKGYVNAFVNAGFINGVAEGILSPDANMIRGDMMALLGQSIAVYATESGEYSVEGKGLVIIVADDVVIKDAPEGTIVVAAPTATGAIVNGSEIAADTTIVVGTTGGTTTGGTTTGGTTTGGTTTGGSTTGDTTTGDTTTGGSTTGGTTTGGGETTGDAAE